MKTSKMTGGLVLTVALLLASSAFAGSKPGSLYLAGATQLNGKELPAGTYQLKWDGSGPAVEVQFLKGKRVVATAPARLEQITSKPAQGSAVIETAGGSRSLVEARFAGKNYKLVFPGAEAQARNAHGGSAAQTNP